MLRFRLHRCFIITRYELSGIGAFNFVLKDSLGGGGVSSIRLDPQVACMHTLFSTRGSVASSPGLPLTFQCCSWEVGPGDEAGAVYKVMEA